MGASEIKIGSLLTKDEFRELTAPNDRISFSTSRSGSASMPACFAMVRAWEGAYPALAFAAFYINAVLWQLAGYAGIGHELFHKKVFSRKWLNTLFFKLFSYVTWNNPSYFEKSHQFHHASTFHEDDSEIYRDFPLDLLGAARLVLLDYQSLCRRILYALCNAFGYEAYFGKGIRLKLMPPERRAAQSDAISMLALNTICLMLFFLVTRSPALGLMFFVTPFVGSLPNRVLALAQHVAFDDHKDESALLFQERSICRHRVRILLCQHELPRRAPPAAVCSLLQFAEAARYPECQAQNGARGKGIRLSLHPGLLELGRSIGKIGRQCHA